MGITPNFTSADFNAELDKKIAAIEKAIENRLSFLGEQCLIEMRTNRTYTDRTGNLTSSMGYVVVMKGRVVTKNGNSPMLDSVVNKNPNSYALYVVAGMDYASYVEAKGYNVISSAELLAEKQLPIMMAMLKNNIK